MPFIGWCRRRATGDQRPDDVRLLGRVVGGRAEISELRSVAPLLRLRISRGRLFHLGDLLLLALRLGREGPELLLSAGRALAHELPRRTAGRRVRGLIRPKNPREERDGQLSLPHDSTPLGAAPPGATCEGRNEGMLGKNGIAGRGYRRGSGAAMEIQRGR